MDVKFKGITWMGNIYQKFEAVCQEVDDIVSKDAVKYVENQVQNVGGSVKKFYSDVVQELRPPFNSVKHGARFLASKTNGSSQCKSIASVRESKKCTTENAVKNVIKSSRESNATDPANNQQSQASIGLDHVNQGSDQTSSDPLEVEDLHIPWNDVSDSHLGETFDVLKEKSHVSTEQNTVESTTQLMHLVSFSEKEPLESSELSESLPKFSDDGCGALAELNENSDWSICNDVAGRENTDMSAEQKSCGFVEDFAINSSTPQLLDFTSLAEKELLDTSLCSESSDSVDEDTHSSIAEALPATSVVYMKPQSSLKAELDNGNIVAGDQCVSGGPQSAYSLASFDVAFSNVSYEKSMKNAKPLWFQSSLISDSQSAKSIGYSEIEPCKNNSVNVAGCNFDSSMLVGSSDIADQMTESQARLISSGNSQAMESIGETPRPHEVMSLINSPGNGQIQSSQDRAIISVSEIDESMVNSVESSLEDIPLSDKTKPEESCTFVHDSELYAVSWRAQGLRSYKKRIQDAFTRRKRLAKEYELLGIWYGDADLDFIQNAQSSGTPLDSKNLQVQHECDNDWELL